MASKEGKDDSTDETELVQTRVNKKAHLLLDARADAAAISRSAYIRRLIYKELGLLKEES